MANETVISIPIKSIKPNPYQPGSRTNIDPQVSKRFAESIQEHGLLQTPVCRQKDGNYEMGDGWLRLAGFKYLFENIPYPDNEKWSRLPVIVRDLTDRQMADLVMEANMVRKDLNPIELANFYKKYLEDFKVSQVELARVHNCSQGEIANTIRLLELPEDIQAKIISQEISETHGRQLLRLNYNPDLQKKMLGRSIKEGYSVNQLSNEVASKMYYESKNIDPDDYPKPEFDIAGCESCQKRQKIGAPYSNEKKRWRCLDTVCYQKKMDQAEKERTDKIAAEIAASKKKGDKGKAGILDCSKLTWRDYQRFDDSLNKIDKSECRSCPRRALGNLWDGKTEMVCIDVKCFKAKEKAYEDKETAKAREAERQLTERVKAACDKVSDEYTAFRLITDYLLSHSRKDTREKFARMYGLKEVDLADFFANQSDPDIIQKTVALVLQQERYEGIIGRFHKMLALLEGNAAEFDKIIADFRSAHCKGCRNDSGSCNTLMKVYLEGKCYAYWKKSKNDEDQEEDLEEQADARDRELDAEKEEAQADKEALEETVGVIDLNLLEIHISTDGQKEHLFTMGDIEVRAKTLKSCVWELAAQLGWGNSQEDILKVLNTFPASSNRDLLISILEEKQPAEAKRD
jgi:ParB family chromosome partitioning protein